jgi:integrase
MALAVSEVEQRVNQYIAHRHAEGLAASTLADMRYRIRRILSDCQSSCIADISEPAIVKWFEDAAIADPATGLPKLSANTRKLNYVYASAFFEWCIMQKLMESNPCKRAPRPKHFKRDRRKFRRAMTPNELDRLVLVARYRPLAEYAKSRMVGSKCKAFWKSNPITMENIEGLASTARDMRGRKSVEELDLDGLKWSLAYRTLATTGIRWEELRTLTTGQITLGDRPELALKSSFTKNGNADRLPLQVDLARDLGEWIDRTDTGDFEPLFELPAKGMKRFLRDIEVAEIPRYDSQGRSVDIHSLRYSFGTLLALRNVHPTIAQRLMRHCKPELTLGIYTDAQNLDTRNAVDSVHAVGTFRDVEPVKSGSERGELLRAIVQHADAETLQKLLSLAMGG